METRHTVKFDADHKLVSSETVKLCHTSSCTANSAQPVFESSLTTKDAHSNCPKLQLVIARFAENISWLNDVSCDFDVVVYNKGKKETLPNFWREVTIIDIANFGRESETYCRHIIENFHNLAEYTIFSQGDPFCHAPYFMDFLTNPSSMSEIQMMSLKYLDNIPPQLLIDKSSEHPWMRLERMSTRTLDSILFRDAGTEQFHNAYLASNNLSPGENIIKHFLDEIGLPHIMSEETEVCQFGYSAIFGVSKSLLQKHNIGVYSAIRSKSVLSWEYGYIIERIWYLLFSMPHSTK